MGGSSAGRGVQIHTFVRRTRSRELIIGDPSAALLQHRDRAVAIDSVVDALEPHVEPRTFEYVEARRRTVLAESSTGSDVIAVPHDQLLLAGWQIDSVVDPRLAVGEDVVPTAVDHRRSGDVADVSGSVLIELTVLRDLESRR